MLMSVDLLLPKKKKTKQKNKTKNTKIAKWISRGHTAAEHGVGCAPVPLASVAFVSVRLTWERRFVCDPVVCSLVLCDHVRQVCEKITFSKKKAVTFYSVFRTLSRSLQAIHELSNSLMLKSCTFDKMCMTKYCFCSVS